MTLAELENAKAESLKEIAAAADAAAVEALRVKYVGRNGSIPALIKAMRARRARRRWTPISRSPGAGARSE